MRATYHKHVLQFKRPAGTSRGILKTKETWYIRIEHQGQVGIGECGILRGLSPDDVPHYEDKLVWVCKNITLGVERLDRELITYPSIRFGVEMAFRSLEAADPFLLYPSHFTTGAQPIAINGLIWMGDFEFMRGQIEQKLHEGWDCIKMKIGAINFEEELALLKRIRRAFTAQDITLRVDANGAFNFENGEALQKLEALSALDLHSIEQPIMPGQIDAMAALCESTPLPIALDEELIGVHDVTKQQDLLQTIQPQYIILKPSLVGGIAASKQWIEHAERVQAGWWVTSALESNVGLNAIAQWTFTENIEGHQGLGTGSLYTNNIESPLVVDRGKLTYHPKMKWDFNFT